MMRKRVFALLAILLGAFSAECYAVGFGIRAGASGRYSDFGSANVQGSTLSTSPRIGFNVGIYTDIKLFGFGSSESSASGLYIRPEGVFTMTGLDVSSSGGQSCRARMQSVDIPVLISVKVKFFRIYAGPTLTAMDKNKTLGADGMDLSTIRPFVNYAAGVGFDMGMFTVDMRYDGVFKRPTGSVRIGEMTTGENVRFRSGGLAVSIGVAF